MDYNSSFGVFALWVICAMEHRCIHPIVIVVFEHLENRDVLFAAHFPQSIVELRSCQDSVAFGLFQQ